MRAIFLADAHLSKPSDLNYQAMLEFLEEQRGRTDLLILLGDIFEFWIGKATVLEDYIPLIKAFERMCQSGTKLVYVEGNHDFHLGPVFTQQLNCQVFPDGGSIELGGKKVYLAHGDLANADDTGYHRLRKLLRSDVIRFLLHTLPNKLLIKIGDQAGNISRKKSGERRSRRPACEILRPYAEAILSAGHQVVVTGHFHQPFHEKLGDGELIALGDWITQYSYAIYEDNSFTLKHYSVASSSSEVLT